MTDKMRNLLVRTVTGVVFVAVVMTMMALGLATYTALLVAIASLCAVEFWSLGQTRTQKWLGVGYMVGTALLMWFFPLIGAGMTDFAGMADPAGVADFAGKGGLVGGGVMANTGVDTGCLFCRDVVLGGLLGDYLPGWDVRIAPAFILTVWANDVFAYLVGITMGRNKMAKNLSPNKSWEGFAGGVVGAVAVAALVGRYVMGGEAILWMAFGLVVSLSAVGGDLMESGFKRRAGVKDSGRLLPGHGGALDRFDAMLGAAPVAFLFFIMVTYLAR
ncbi:MAG: phosphatidate cytidylyltransferase [Alistipes sp.]|jgi:phosphatidate cytidylyltransferase|nr:phosphatidate cytidylyltransferase [Alistipes sp.]